MGHTIEEKARQKENEKSIKELSMEGFPPTMLGVVFLKELQIIRKGSDRQGLFELYRLRVLIECGHFYMPQKDVFNNVWG